MLATLLINPLGETGKNIVYINPLIRLPEFLAGVALGMLVIRGWQPRIPLSVALVVLVIGAAAPHHWFSLHYLADYMVIPGFVFLIASCVGADLRRTKGRLTSRSCIYLGELSFCFYLVHYLAMNAIVNELGIRHRHYSLLGGALPLILVLGVSAILAAASTTESSCLLSAGCAPLDARQADQRLTEVERRPALPSRSRIGWPAQPPRAVGRGLSFSRGGGGHELENRDVRTIP